MDAISGYGDFKQLTKDEISVQLRDLKGQMQQVAKLEDMQAGQPPLKTGLERRTPSIEESRLIKLVNQAKNEFQIPISDSATQLKSDLDTLKTRLTNRTRELQERLAAGDFSKRQRREIKLDTEAQRLKADAERARLDFRRGLIKDRLEKRTAFQKAMDGIAKWRRTFILSWPTILGKLTSASAELVAITPAEEAIGGVVSKIIPKVAAKAPRQGGLSVKAEAAAIAGTWRTLFKASMQKWKTGNSDIDLAYGNPSVMPHELKDYIATIHGALKEPARQNEFFRSFQKRMDHAAANGIDITDPMVQTKIGFEAYKDANRQIFMENNMLADFIQRGLTRFSQADKTTGKVSMLGKAAETAVRFELPIIRIPLNLVKRAFEYSFGTATGAFRLGRAMSEGLDNLKPEEADIIMRNFKRGSLGLAFVAIGFFNPENVGGYYQHGKKRSAEDVEAGGLTIFGQKIPRLFIHNPLLEQLQIGATIRRVADSKLHKKDKEDQGYAAGIMAAYGGLIEETPFVREAEDSLKALDPYQRNKFLGELLKSAIPGVVEWTARQMDKDAEGNVIQRAPKTPIETLQTAIPGMRENVPERKK
jgi:hypothetical protein